MLQDYQIDVKLTDGITGNELFVESYKLRLLKKFVDSHNAKEHNFKNHVEGFLTLIKKNCTLVTKRTFKKREIYPVEYNMGVGSEVLGTRPSILYKRTKHTRGEDLLFIPLTSAQQEKQTDALDVFVPKDSTNNLFQNSYARLRQLKSSSVLRVGKSIGIITDEKVKAVINDMASEMLGFDE